MFFSRPAGIKFTDRGDPAAADFTIGNFTIDSAIHELDLSSIIPAGCVAVMLSVDFLCTSPSKDFQFVKHGNTNYHNRFRGFSQVANTFYACQGVVFVSDDRKIDYSIAVDTWVNFNVTICGWWV